MHSRTPTRSASLATASLLLLAQFAVLLAIAPAASAAPAVGSISPATGNTNGDTLVTITSTGTNFETSSTVTFGGVAVTACTDVDTPKVGCAAPTTSVHKVLAPARAAAGAVNVVVTNPSDGASTTVTGGYTYTLASAPTITSININSGPTTGSTVITITGTNFHVDQAKPAVAFGTTPGVVGAVTATTIVATSPAHAAGAVDVVVTNPDAQKATLANGFTFVAAAAPTLTSVAPGSGTSNAGVTTLITLTGTNFVSGATVQFGGVQAVSCTGIDVPATGCTVPTATSKKVIMPPHAAGVVDVVFNNPDGQIATLANGFGYIADAAPTLISSPIAPTSGPVVGGTPVTLTGTGFSTGATAQVGGKDCLNVVVVSAISITCVTPSGTAGVVAVKVRNADGQEASIAGVYTYVAVVEITGVSPASGPSNGGTTLTLTGTGFVSGMTVSFDDGATFLAASGSGSSATVVTPAKAAGTAHIIVRNPDGKSSSLQNGFQYTSSAAPTVTAIACSPACTAGDPQGDENGGTTLIITGTNFHTGTNAKPTVTLGGTAVAASATTVTLSTSITIVTPPHVAGDDVALTVTNPDTLVGTFAPTTATDKFDYAPAPAPTVTSIACVPACTTGDPEGSENGGTTLDISGTGFHTGTNQKPVVVIGGTTVPSAQVTVTSASIIRIVTPGHAAGDDVTLTVTNPDGDLGAQGVGTGRFDYTNAAAPVITSLSSLTGPTTGRTAITITGTDFATGATVQFGATAGTVTSVTATSIAVTTPAKAAGAVTVTVTNPGSDVSNGQAFTFTLGSSPTITALSPASGISDADAPLTPVPPAITTLTGTNFGPNGITVNFGSTAGTLCTAVDTPNTGCTAPTATQLAVVPPAGVAGAVTVTVTNADSQAGSLGSGYTYLSAPPRLASLGVSALTGSTNGVTTGAGAVTGSDLAATMSFLYGGAIVQSYALTGTTTLGSVAIPPRATAGSVAVAAYGRDGQSALLKDAALTSAREDFTYIAAVAPTVGLLSVTAGPANGGTVVTVTGANFAAGLAKPTVNFGGAFATLCTATNTPFQGCAAPTATSLVVMSSAHAAGATNVVVTNPDMQAVTKTNGFTFVGAGGPPAPTLTTVSPTSGPTTGGTNITLTGTNFSSGATVTVGGAACTSVVVVSATSITCKTPAGTAGAQDVVVTASGGTATKVGGYTYTASTSTSTSGSTSASSSGSSTSRSSTSGSSSSSAAATCSGANLITIKACNDALLASIKVTRADGKNTVTWTLPNGASGALGIQLWRSNSPYTLVATLFASDAAYDDPYVDSAGNENSGYLVTTFFAQSLANGFFPCQVGVKTCADAPDDTVYKPATLPTSFPWVTVGLWVGGILLLVLVVVLVVVLVRRNGAKKTTSQEPQWQDAGTATAAEGWQDAGAAPEAGSGELHTLQCPACGTQFTATGAKPLTTVCPGCNRTGILR